METKHKNSEISFKLSEGIRLSAPSKPCEFFEKTDDGFFVYPSADKMIKLLSSAADALDEPMFFFLELPDEDENGMLDYSTYYLECTKPVAKAIVKRYGELLINDGVSRFGFGSHKSGEEIYFEALQRVYICTSRCGKFSQMISSIGIDEGAGQTVFDLFDPEKDDLSLIEIDGETVFDAAENLKSAGLYLAEE